jgi:DNA helicase IV
LREGITSWDEIAKVIKEAKTAELFQLDTNFRSTKPIIELARSILEPYTNKFLPRSIERIGSDPVIESFSSKEELLQKMREEIKKDTEKIEKSIGIVCFNDEVMAKTEKILEKMKFKDRNLIKLEKDKKIDYSAKGLYLMDFENCKGLEFSKVYLIDLNLETVNNINEAKRAFIAVSRAMNDLNVYYVK